MADQEPQGYKEWREIEKKCLEYLEDITSHPSQEQEKFLKRVLKRNAETTYLQSCELNGATDVNSFRDRVPVSDYDSYKPYVDRIVNGDKTPLLCADPVVEIMASSGTSGGEPKLFPITVEDLELRGLIWNLIRPVLNRALPGLEKGKNLFFYFMRQGSMTPGGLPCYSAVTSFINSPTFQQRPFDPSYIMTSPDEVTETLDNNAGMYCHLLLGLLQREEVLRFASIFASMIVKAMRTLEELHLEICYDIANGTLSASVEDETLRSAVLPLLRKDPELAEFVRNQYGPGKSSDGIIRRLWPNAKVIDTVCTGSMEAYLPAIANYSANLPVICTALYAATEGYFGINLNPICPPEEIYYTLLPSLAYYEFIAVFASSQCQLDPAQDETLDLVNLKIGREYEILLTTVSGLYRYRLGDILRVVGHYNSIPVFQFVRRMNTVLSVDTDKTDEKELFSAVNRAAKLMETELGLRLLDYTSTADIESNPGHYVIFWELDLSASTTSPTQQVLERCCLVMETALNFIYRRGRHGNGIGPLELRVVEQGTFDDITDHAIAKGATLSQYKTPRSLGRKNASVLEFVNSRVTLNGFSQGKPPFGSGTFRTSLSTRHFLRESPSGRHFTVVQNTI